MWHGRDVRQSVIRDIPWGCVVIRAAINHGQHSEVLRVVENAHGGIPCGSTVSRAPTRHDQCSQVFKVAAGWRYNMPVISNHQFGLSTCVTNQHVWLLVLGKPILFNPWCLSHAAVVALPSTRHATGRCKELVLFLWCVFVYLLLNHGQKDLWCSPPVLPLVLWEPLLEVCLGSW